LPGVPEAVDMVGVPVVVGVVGVAAGEAAPEHAVSRTAVAAVARNFLGSRFVGSTDSPFGCLQQLLVDG
jgi:hypothetical protein